MWTLRKLTQWLCYYIIPLALLLFFLSYTGPRHTARDAAVTLGSLALWLFIIILFAKPLSTITRIDPLARIVSYRRELGVLLFYLACFHGMLMLVYTNGFTRDGLSQLTDPTDRIFWGAIGLVCIIALGITSNTYSVIRLGKHWKRLHYLAYPALGFVSIHQAMVEHEVGILLLFAAFVLLKFWELRIVRSKKAAQKS